MRERQRPRLLAQRYAYSGLWLLAALTVLAASATAAFAKSAAGPAVPAGFTITKIANAPKGATNCDDLVFLDGHLFMGCQNATFSNGGGGNSTLVEYGLDGTIVNTWSLKDKIDGLGSDPLHHRVLITFNEDAHSHFGTLTPSAPAGQQFTNYMYSPAPDSPSAPSTLKTGGGTDNISVDSNGNVLITGSHALHVAGTAVFKATLTPPSSPTGTGTVTLSPTFADDATATKGNQGSGTVKLSLIDVDSGAIVPPSSPKYAGDYVIDDQTALELVFASNIFAGTGLTVVKTPYGLDDLRWVTSDGGTLYVVDLGSGTAGKSVVYKVTGPFVKNTVLATNDTIGPEVDTLNLTTGKLAPFIKGLQTAKGLVYLDPSGAVAQLALTGAPTPVSASSTATATSTASASSSTSTTGSGGSSNTALIVIIVIAAVALLGGGGYVLYRRSKTG